MSRGMSIDLTLHAPPSYPPVPHFHGYKEKVDAAKIEDFDDMLVHVGGWGRYQYIILAFFMVITMFFAYVLYSPILVLEAPDHWCTVNGLLAENFTQEEIVSIAIPFDEGKRSKCEMYDLDYGKVVDGKIDVNGNKSEWLRIPCKNGWSFNYTGSFETITSELSWVCDESWKPAFTQTIFFVGAVIGCIGFGFTTDHYGRFWTCMASNILLFVSGVATGFCRNFVSFTVMRFIMGLSFPTAFSCYYILAMEYVAVNKRSIIGNLTLAISLTLGSVYLPWMLLYIGEWRVFHHILYGQMAVILILPSYLHESCRWLISRGRVDECIKILDHIADTNQKNVPIYVYDSFKEMCKKNQEQEKRGRFLDILKKPRLRKNYIAMLAVLTLVQLSFDGHVRNISNLGLPIAITFTVSCALEFPSDMLTIVGLEYLGRRWSAAMSAFLSGAMMILCVCFEDPVLVMVLAMIGRFWVTFALNTMFQLQIEVVPTEIRGQGTALGNVLAQGATLFSPLIVYTSVVSEAMPFLILGGTGIVAGVIALFIPETADEILPETIDDGEKFGADQRFWSCFFVEKWRKTRKVQPEQKEEQSEDKL